jgi:aspartate/tyrosine/aromatic aminotransferase
MTSFFDEVPLAPPNSILGVSLECRNDPAQDKIDLTIGAYRGDDGKPLVLDCVRQAERIIYDGRVDHEYLVQDGLGEFNRLAQILMFGSDSVAITESRVFTMQGISGTGSLRVASEFIGHFMAERTCYIPAVTWPAHPTILAESRVTFGTYR